MDPSLEAKAEKFALEIFKNWLNFYKWQREKNQQKKAELKRKHDDNQKILKGIRKQITGNMSPEEKKEFDKKVNLISSRERNRVLGKDPKYREKIRAKGHQRYDDLYRSDRTANVGRKSTKPKGTGYYGCKVYRIPRH